MSAVITAEPCQEQQNQWQFTAAGGTPPGPSHSLWWVWLVLFVILLSGAAMGVLAVWRRHHHR